MTLEENKKVVIRFNKEVLEKGRTEIIREMVADDLINWTAPSSVPNTIEGVVQNIKMMHEGLSDFYVEIHEQLAERDLVATHKTIHATHTGEIMGHKPTNKRIAIDVMDFVRLRDGKYIEHWGRNNFLQIIQSL